MSKMNNRLRRILIVDDNKSIHEDFKNILKNFDYKNKNMKRIEKEIFEQSESPKKPVKYVIDEAYQAHEAIAMVDKAAQVDNPYHLVFMDVRMPPGMDGVQAVKKIREKHTELEFVICTAYADYTWDEILKELKETEHVYFLKKPFNSVEIKQIALSLTTKRINDIKKKNYLEELKQKENEYRQLYETPVVGLYRTRLDDGQLIKANKTALKIFGYDDLQQAKNDKLIPSELYPTNVKAKLELDSSKTLDIAPFEIKINSEEKPIFASIKARVFKQFNYLEGSVLDITKQKVMESELKEKEKQLIQAQKMETVGNLAGGLAHDFNNMLGGILGSNSLIRCVLNDDNPDLNEIKELVNVVDNTTQKAARMANQLLTLSKKQELSFTNVDLNLAVKHVVKICRNSFDKTIQIEPVYSKSEALCFADPTQIEQILLNFCINASHAMTIMKEDKTKIGGILELKISRFEPDASFLNKYSKAESKDYWLIEIADQGVGMDEELQTKIFDPFFTTKPKGTGLGLSMAYSIIKKHKGFIEVNSEKNEGATFFIYLPRLEIKTDSELKKISKDSLIKGSGIILIVDDEKLLRVTAKKILTLCGYEIITAENGKAAVEILKNNKEQIDAILLDVSMPTKSGLETYNEIKKIYPNINVVVTSGYNQDKRVEDLLFQGADDYIQKPYSIFELSKIIKKYSN